jgi:hypothetical protein
MVAFRKSPMWTACSLVGSYCNTWAGRHVATLSVGLANSCPSGPSSSSPLSERYLTCAPPSSAASQRLQLVALRVYGNHRTTEHWRRGRHGCSSLIATTARQAVLTIRSERKPLAETSSDVSGTISPFQAQVTLQLTVSLCRAPSGAHGLVTRGAPSDEGAGLSVVKYVQIYRRIGAGLAQAV